jgi:hypothetical protein
MSGLLDPALMAKMRFGQLDELRSQFPDQSAQDLIAPYEHRAYAREIVKENPLFALGLFGAIPGYQAAKVTGLQKTRSKPSMEQMIQAYKGLFEGLRGE